MGSGVSEGGANPSSFRRLLGSRCSAGSQGAKGPAKVRVGRTLREPLVQSAHSIDGKLRSREGKQFGQDHAGGSAAEPELIPRLLYVSLLADWAPDLADWAPGPGRLGTRPGRGIPRKARGSSGPQGRWQAAGTCTLSLAHPVRLSSPRTGWGKEERQQEKARGYTSVSSWRGSERNSVYY